MEYFGTDLKDYGHYRWTVTENGLMKNWNNFSDLPFNPEQLTNNLPKGEVVYYQGGGFTVVAISGSPKDTRPGTKSVFWVKELIDRNGMVQLLKNNKTAMTIIGAMPFEVLF